MRMFLNAIFDFKPKDKAFVTVPPILKEVLEDGGWSPERLLFDLYDINEAASEGHTPHAKLMKKFPQLQPYWHNTSERYAAMNQRPVWSDEPIPPTCPHGYGFFSNFPGRKEGKAVFYPNDSAIDNDVLEGICAAIPRPCSFYSAIVVWDAIPWYMDSNLIPALRNMQPGHDQEDFSPGEWDGNHDFYECCIGYQSNCLLLSYEFGTGPELEVRVELTDTHPMEEALTVIEHFAKRFGKPVKQCVRAVFPWEMRKEISDKLVYMRTHFDGWYKSGITELKALYHQMKECPPDKQVSGKTLAKRFVERNGFARHDLCRWDDYGWCKRLPHGYWLHLDLFINPTARYASPVNMVLICYGVNFRIQYGCSLHTDFRMPRDTPADAAAFQVFQVALDRFQNEVVPRLAEVFGDTPNMFYQHSHALDTSKEFDV
ncbi:MAG: hypothetical protein K2O16_12400 [Lachnospiraceae bacterium]|nr:hypothetical protein [Lachnospiraceae bacterium]